MKPCTACTKSKEFKEFNKKAKAHDGLYPQCRDCQKTRQSERYHANTEAKERIKANAAKYYENNKEKVLARLSSDEYKLKKKLRWHDNKDEILEKQRQYREANKGIYTERKKEYRKENREKIQERENAYYKENPLARLSKSIRSRLGETLKNKGFSKTSPFTESIGCSYEKLKEHLEVQFHSGMTWDNHGEVWHVDHRIPISYGQSEAQVYELNHYLNLQPMLAHENESKNNLRADICWQKLKRDKLNEEDRTLGYNFDLAVSDFEFSEEPITDEHRQFIERYEWLGTCGFGVHYVFTARHEGKLAGVVMLAEPNSYQFGENEALIQRGACSSWAPRNLNSKLVMFACRWMVRNTEKRIFVAYSDPQAGEIGTIYQACNFDYLGAKFGADEMFILENGKQVSSRYFTRTSSMKKWAKALGIKWEKEWSKENGFQNLATIPEDVRMKIKEYIFNMKKSLKKIKKPAKGKYVLLLNYGKQQIKKTWTSCAYPKRK